MVLITATECIYCAVGAEYLNIFHVKLRLHSHSTEFLVCVGNKINRLDVILSHIMNRNIITLTNEIVDPIDEIIFHVVYASG